MNVYEKVKFLEKEIKENKTHNSPFNIWAFIFSSFYFLYIGMDGYFLVFALLPFALSIPLLIFTFFGLAFVIGFVISHIVAGFIANRAYKKYREEFVEEHKGADLNKTVEYFAISSLRLILGSIITGGFYLLYWNFKNWNVYQKTTKDDINPYIRAWFYHLTMPFLFKNMNKTIKPKKSLVLYGVLYLLSFVAISIISYLANGNINIQLLLVLGLTVLALYLATPFLLLPVQRAVNRYTTETLQKPLVKKFLPWEIFFLIFGTIITLANIFSPQESLWTQEQEEKIGASVGFIYRHTQAYSDFCKKSGYELKIYPDEFRAYFAQDIENLEAELATQGLTIEGLQQTYITPQAKEFMERLIAEEFDWLKKSLTLAAISQQANIPAENLSWKDDMSEIMTMEDVCSIFDEVGMSVLKSGENKDFLSKNSL